MKLQIEVRRILIVPETEQDEAYIRDTLRIKKEGDFVKCVQVSAMGMPSCLAYLEIKKNQNEEALDETI